MRVALVCGYDWAVPGGVRSQVDALARALAAAGEQVAVVTAATPVAAHPPKVDGVRMYRAGRSFGFSANGSVAPVAPTPAAAWRTRRALAEIGADVVHVHEPLVPGPPLAAVLGARAPVVATFHRSGADPVYRFEGRLLGPVVARHIAAATAVSKAAEATAREVIGRHLGDVVEVPNGVDLERAARARAAFESGRTANGGPFKSGARPVVAFFGRHEPRKGAAVLIEALRSLEGDLDVVIGGAGPQSQALEAAAAPDRRVRFVGRLDDDEMAKVVAGADVFVAPSLSGESFGIVLLEAMAAGTCVVASDLPGYRLAATGAAVHVPPGNAPALAESLAGVLGDADRRHELVKLGLRRAAAASIRQVASAYLEVYRGVVGWGTGPRRGSS